LKLQSLRQNKKYAKWHIDMSSHCKKTQTHGVEGTGSDAKTGKGMRLQK